MEEGQEQVIHHITEPNQLVDSNDAGKEFSSAPAQPLMNDLSIPSVTNKGGGNPASTLPTDRDRERIQQTGQRTVYDKSFFRNTNRSGKNTTTVCTTPQKTFSYAVSPVSALTPTDNLNKSTNFLHRRMQKNRGQPRVYGGTDQAVSPSSYKMKALTGKQVFESKYKQGPMCSFGRESTGRNQIKNNHN